jgi:sterol desaturase/sphingolipid hydroxylase (fatty acid hydroxylase superfamily)
VDPGITSIILIFIAGHLCGALGFYLNHRFILHGKIGDMRFFRKLKRLHTLHHAHPYDDKRNDHIAIPLWGKLLMAKLVLVLSIFSVSFALGGLSFFLYYGYRHHSIHNKDKSSYFSRHHRYHHVRDPRVNHSGVYPFVDIIFGTYYLS